MSAPATRFALRRVGPPGPPRTVELDALAREAGLHPDVVGRFVRMGLLEPAPFPRDAAARLAKASRLRHDLGLNYAGAVLACELLARIDALEARRP
jgi:chaperone modulatory protein CbpM